MQAAAPIEERVSLEDVMTESFYRVGSLDDISAVLAAWLEREFNR